MKLDLLDINWEFRCFGQLTYKFDMTKIPKKYYLIHGLLTPNEGKNQRYLKNWADVADKICLGRT